MHETRTEIHFGIFASLRELCIDNGAIRPRSLHKVINCTETTHKSRINSREKCSELSRINIPHSMAIRKSPTINHLELRPDRCECRLKLNTLKTSAPETLHLLSNTTPAAHNEQVLHYQVYVCVYSEVIYDLA